MAPFEMVAFVRNGHFIGLLSSSFVKVVVHVSVSHFVNMSGPLPLTSRFFFFLQFYPQTCCHVLLGWWFYDYYDQICNPPGP